MTVERCTEQSRPPVTGERPGFRVLAKLTIKDGRVVSLDAGDIPKLNLNTGERTLPTAAAGERDKEPLLT